MERCRNKLIKTKVDMYSSEYNISKMISEFWKECTKTDCHNCNIVRKSENLFNSELCLARYIYERIIKIEKI